MQNDYKQTNKHALDGLRRVLDYDQVVAVLTPSKLNKRSGGCSLSVLVLQIS